MQTTNPTAARQEEADARLMRAALAGDFAETSAALALGADPESDSGFGMRAIDFASLGAALPGRAECIVKLVAAGADGLRTGPDGFTAGDRARAAGVGWLAEMIDRMCGRASRSEAPEPQAGHPAIGMASSRTDASAQSNERVAGAPENVAATPMSGRASKRRLIGIGWFKDKAKELGGACLSEEYVGIGGLLEFACGQGHRWSATGKSLRYGHWCPECSFAKMGPPGPRYDIQTFKELALSRGGKCLSDEFVALAKKLRWECAKGHEWMASGSSVKYAHSWCPHCHWSTTKNATAAMEEHARMDEPSLPLAATCKKEQAGEASPLPNHEAITPSAGSLPISTRAPDAFEFSEKAAAYANEVEEGRMTAKQAIALLRAQREASKAREASPARLDEPSDDQGGAQAPQDADGAAAPRRRWVSGPEDGAAARDPLGYVDELGWWHGRPASSMPRRKAAAEAAPPVLDDAPKKRGRERLGLDVFRKIAEGKGGRLLTEAVDSAAQKLEFECAQGHRWLASRAAIKQVGTWCPWCSRQSKGSRSNRQEK